MNEAAAKENRLTLQNLLGLTDAASQKVLGSTILLSIQGEHPRLSEFLQVILGKTFEHVHTVAQSNFVYSCEVVTDSGSRITKGPYVLLRNKDKDGLAISTGPVDGSLYENNHPFIYFITACYAGGMVLKTIYNELPVTTSKEILIEINKVIPDPGILTQRVNIGSAHLAGAGAVGNAFLYALSTFSVEGQLKVVDPDFVSGGNLNRCLFFTENDIDKKKVDALVLRAQPLFDNLSLIAMACELAKLPDNNGAAWLEKLIVCVDSRRARRSLQGEIPGEVFDASTTGITEVVVHHHKRPLQAACLGCVYIKEKQEEAHETHVAEALGVSLFHVRQQFITSEAASLIAKKYQIDSTTIIGVPYDTLFKQLCGEGKLFSAENNQVLAPLAFVSALAGAFLALLVIEQHSKGLNFNYWRISPWATLNFRLQQNIPKNDECEFCNSKTYTQVAERLWGRH